MLSRNSLIPNFLFRLWIHVNWSNRCLFDLSLVSYLSNSFINAYGVTIRVELIFHFHVHERVGSFSRSYVLRGWDKIIFLFNACFFFFFCMLLLLWVLLWILRVTIAWFLYFCRYFVTQTHVFFDFRIGLGCLKIWYYGVSWATFCSLFPGDQSVADYCSWLVSCTGWHINIGRRCEEESESGYKYKYHFCFVLSFSLVQIIKNGGVSVTACVLCV